MNFSQFIFISNNVSIDNESTVEFEILNELKSASYPTTYANTGENLNISLHQSYLNNTFDTVLNVSDSSNNKFSIPSPIDTLFNSSYARFDIKDISAPNKTLTVEDDLGVEVINPVSYHYISFEVIGSGYIENITLHARETNAPDTTGLTIYLYNAINDSGNIRPDTSIATIVTNSEITSTSFYWHKMTGIHSLINISETYSNTFFLNLEKNGPGSTNVALNGTFDTAIGDNKDESIVLDSGENPHTIGGINVDAALIVDLAPLNNTPSPEQVGLKINNSLVTGYGDGIDSGFWESSNVSSNVSGELQYLVSAEWWNVICNTSQVLINYTRTDLKAKSEFTITGSGQNVNWNVTRSGGLNYFDSDFSNFQINFTIPDSWLDASIRAFKDAGDERTSGITKRLLGNGYRDIKIPNAGNGSFWFVNATSNNLLNTIDTYVSNQAYSTVNYTNTVRINGTFTDFIKNGILNLSVYSPSPNYLNHTKILNISKQVPGSEFNVSDWDISNNATEYGIYRVYMAWSNGTAAGLLIGTFTILGETELIIEAPQAFTFDASTIFNITVFFNDTGQNQDITNANVKYKLNNGLIRTTNVTEIGNGRYNITVDCNDTDFTSNGQNSIMINASKAFHINRSESVDLTIIGETSLTIIEPPNDSAFDSINTFNITIEFKNTVRDELITNPIINYSLDGGSTYRGDNIIDIGNNRYNITIDCNNTDFGNYGPQTIIVNASKQFYHNQSVSLNITITGNTGLTLIKWPDKAFYYSDEVFNITASYSDISRNQGITGATITIEVGGSLHATSWEDIGGGDYNITITCSDPIFGSFGYFSLRINASRQYYYESSNSSLDLIIGNTSLTVLAPSDGSIFIDRQVFNITVKYNDVVKDQGILGADINYSLNEGVSYRTDNVTYLGNGEYNITIYANHSDFQKFGFLDIIINASKQFYNNLSKTLTIHRQISTSITPSNTPDLGSVIRGLNISYTFDYSEIPLTPIIGASWTQISPGYGFSVSLKDWANGTYTIRLDTTNVNVAGSPFTYIFNVFATGNETQTISLTIDVTIIQTAIENLKWNLNFARNAHLNQTISFFFRDTTNNQPVLGLTTNNTRVKNNATGTVWNTNDFNWRLINQWNNGTYLLDISTNGLDSGWYTLELNVSKDPNYDISLAYATFYLRGNYSQINLISIEDPGGALSNISQGHHYRIFEGSDIDFQFNITDLEFNNNLVLDAASSYFVSFKNLNTSVVSTLQSTFQFIYPNHVGPIITSVPGLTAGNYLINISTTISNYENATFIFNLTVIEKYDVRITVIDKPDEVTAGNVFGITVKAEYFDGSSWLPLLGESIILTPFFDDTAGDPLDTILTNNSGFYFFEVPTRTDAENITLTVAIQVAFNHLGDTIDVLDINLIPPPAGLDLSDFIPYLILIGVVLAAIGGSVGIYKGVVVPKKREKTRILNEVKTIFDDAINLEHILVLYKGTGTSI
jgi:hypothetical protein